MLLPVGPLPDDPIAAAAAFHATWLPQVLAELDAGRDVVTLLFAPAPHGHADWRLAAVQMLARERTPARINAIAADDPAGIAATVGYFDRAPGVTGQYFVIDGHGAGQVVSCPA
ncbi:Rossmann fold domain-containing protein [Novosphingobium bradum]|uniref:Rossmann fold domain-containing protein n=1 Tax=Novosphingobium bradum TaxID=1737444 RepID=A0ABV7IQL4_9SPHN